MQFWHTSLNRSSFTVQHPYDASFSEGDSDEDKLGWWCNDESMEKGISVYCPKKREERINAFNFINDVDDDADLPVNPVRQRQGGT